MNLLRPFNSFASWLYASGRRMMFKYPTSTPAEAHISWLQEQVRAYATPQPYASPLTTTSDNISGETWEMRLAYRRMCLKEPSVKASLLTKCLAVAQLDLQSRPADPTDARSRESARWVKWSMTHSKGGVPALIWNMLFAASVDGFSVTEKVLDTVPTTSPKYGGFWTLKQGKGKDTNGIRFRLDTFKNIVGVQSMTAAQGGANFDPADFLIFTHLKVFENPFGLSDLRAANRAVNLIESAIKLRAILLENFSGPYIIGKAADSGTRQKMMQTLKTARARGWIVVPEGAELEVLNLATSAPDQFQNTIEDLRREVVTAIQGAYLQLLEGGISDGRGNTQVHKGIAELFQWWLATQVAAVFNDSLVPDLIHPNYGDSVGMPVITLGGVNDAVVLQALQRFKAGQDLGLTLSKSQAMEVGGFESPEDADDALVPPQQQQPGVGPGGGNPFGGGGPDMSNIFGPPGDNDPDPGGAGDEDTVTFSDDELTVPFDAARFADLPGVAFRATDPATGKMADWKPGTNKAGVQGWISSGGLFRKEDPRPKEQAKATARAASEDHVTDVITAPHKITGDHVKTFREHLDSLPRDKVRELAKAMSLKAGGLKVHLAERLVAFAKGEKQPQFDYGKKAPKETLTAVVKRFGGIDPNSHELKTHVSGMKEAMEYGINLGVFRKGGRGLDQIAKELHAAGHIASPDSEHLFEKLKQGAMSLHAENRKAYEDAEAAYWQAQHEAEEYAKKSSAHRSRVEKALRDGESAGRSAATGDPFAEVGGVPGASRGRTGYVPSNEPIPF